MAQMKNNYIAPNVYRFPHQTFYGESVGCYLIEEQDFILLIDGPMNLSKEHEDFILHFKKPIKVFMSHGPTAGQTGILQKAYATQIYLHKDDGHNQWLTVKPDVLFTKDFDFDENLHVIHTPGHSPGSSVVFDSRNKILFTGDHIAGNQEGTIHDFTEEHLESAQKLLQYDFDAIYPFHYSSITRNAKSILAAYLAQLER